VNPPPFLVSFSTVEQFLKALPEDVCELYGDAFEDLASKGFPPVVSIRCLATLFGYSPKFTGAMYQRTERYYRTFSIPKGKRRRTIHAPKVALKVIQKWFGFHLAEVVKFDESVFGFVKGRSAITAAALHCGSDWVYSVDIEDFFPSTPLSKVVGALTELGYPRRGAGLIAKLCCYNGMLSQGSPASPILSNLVFRDADAELSVTAKKFELHYTRYADDIVFSGKGAFPEEIKTAVHTVIQSRGWKIAKQKERLAKRPNRLKVHGLLVHGDKPRLTKGYRNKIRAFKYLLANESVDPEDVAKLKGHISYARSVDIIS
jgi:retron-type reverse transcriptase